MVASRNHCDPRRLRLAIDDRLPGEADSDLASHLEQCDDCRQRLEAMAADAAWWSKARHCLSPDPSEEAPAPDGERPWLGFLKPCDGEGRLGVLGPYEVTDVVGSGGMGIVLKAFDTGLARYVAVKVLAPHLATSGAARRRFAREAQAAAAVVHEHVVAIHAVQEAEGLPYLVMPFIDGHSLQERLNRQGPLELNQIVRIGVQAAAGLAAAHAQGLVHRDVKPANILLENGVERVKLTDFGLARTIDDASLTQSGVLAGTPQYMAPEQARGEAVDHRSDLFSLGSVLYAMCTGHSPFRAETMVGVLRRLCDERPRPIRQVNPDIPEWFAEIVERLHEKEPARRFQSAEEVADLLGRHLAHLQQPALAPQPPRLSRRRAAQRHARLAAIVLLPAAAALVAAGAWFWPGGGPDNDGPSEQQAAPSQATVDLSEWNLFERELEQARRETADVERQVGEIDDVGPLHHDSLPAIDSHLEMLERQLSGP